MPEQLVLVVLLIILLGSISSEKVKEIDGDSETNDEDSVGATEIIEGRDLSIPPFDPATV